MEEKPVNYFVSTLIQENDKASPPSSLFDKRAYIDPLSDREVKIYKEEEDTVPQASQFS